MGFVEGSLGEAKFIGDDIFPKTLLPAAGSDRNLAKSVVAGRESLVALLRRHRALLFRGFDVASADDFERAVEAFEWDAYQFSTSVTTRTKLSDRIYTANESSPQLLINFHQEMPLRKEPPSNIFFYCSEPSPEGGETSIVASDVVVEKMEERLPEVMDKVADVGLIHINKTCSDADADTSAIFNKTWKSFLGTDDKVEAEKRAIETLNCSSVRFFSDGSADLVVGPLNPVVEREGRRAWVVPLLGCTGRIDMVGNEFGDGSAPFPQSALHAYREILAENCVDIKWQKGDVLLVDNFAVQHARRPGKSPRRVLVSMCK
ncbi:Clavaminate synthase-like protein [Platanthera zijinensis]|uniref:Clavaminate synthase-like protein n=1 Tax=Platanthera zijinensis TaxID=2320716 RepID=A0AAP0GC80_9ASPA